MPPRTKQAARRSHAIRYGLIFDELQEEAHNDWRAFVEHDLLLRLRYGILYGQRYKHFLEQRYLSLMESARAWALLGVKCAGCMEQMRLVSRTLTEIVDVEITWHVRECHDIGTSVNTLKQMDETLEKGAYSRFATKVGVKGDALDLLVALAPCILGYGAIGHAILDAWGEKWSPLVHC